jgi:hypothetical protein
LVRIDQTGDGRGGDGCDRSVAAGVSHADSPDRVDRSRTVRMARVRVVGPRAGAGWLTCPMARTSTPAAESERRLGQARARRWWVTGRRVKTIERATSFLDDVGFALLFPTPRVFAPSLWEAVTGEDIEPFAAGMGPDEQKVWTWKDELPRRGLAWYGAFVAGRGSFLSPELLAALYPGAGTVDDHESLPLSRTAHEIARALADEPLPSAVLRTLIGARNRYQRGIAELQRQLLVTTAGVQQSDTGWPSARLELTCRRFDVGGRLDSSYAVGCFMDTMLEATPADLARAFRWPLPTARTRLDDLVEAERASTDGRFTYFARPKIRGSRHGV